MTDIQLNRQRKTKEPCSRCRMHADYCFCTEIPRLVTETRVSVLVHYKELRRTTNTGQLAVHALEKSALYVRGDQNNPFDAASILSQAEQTLLFFPSDDAIDLKDFKRDGRPVHLIVPDGNWRQAAKVHTRHKEFANLPRVKISAPNTQTQFLRKETTPEGMATLQAIAEAIEIIESKGQQLRDLYQLKLDRTMKARGVQSPNGTNS